MSTDIRTGDGSLEATASTAAGAHPAPQAGPHGSSIGCGNGAPAPSAGPALFYVLTDATDAKDRPVILMHRYTARAKRWQDRWHLTGQWDARDRKTALAVRGDLFRKAQP